MHSQESILSRATGQIGWAGQVSFFMQAQSCVKILASSRVLTNSMGDYIQVALKRNSIDKVKVV